MTSGPLFWTLFMTSGPFSGLVYDEWPLFWTTFEPAAYAAEDGRGTAAEDRCATYAQREPAPPSGGRGGEDHGSTTDLDH